MKKIISIACIIVFTCNLGFSFWKNQHKHTVDKSLSPAIIWDMKEHSMDWVGNGISCVTMHIQVENRTFDPITGIPSYRIHAHTWYQDDMLDFMNISLMNKKIYDVRMTDYKYNGFWADVDLWFEGNGDFAYQLLDDEHYQGFEN